MQRPVAAYKESFLQDWILAAAPGTIYPFAPFLAGVFLWDSSSNQFAFALLPAMTAQSSVVWKLLAAAYEFYCFAMWLAVDHFGLFHCITFLRVVQRQLVDCAAAANIE